MQFNKVGYYCTKAVTEQTAFLLALTNHCGYKKMAIFLQLLKMLIFEAHGIRTKITHIFHIFD